MHDAWRGELEKTDAVRDLLVFLFHRVRAQEGKVALELTELRAGHRVVRKILRAARHGK